MGRDSLSPKSSVHIVDGEEPPASSLSRRLGPSSGRLVFQLACHPGSSGLLGFFPCPSAGFDDGYAMTNCRNRPTVTSNASREKGASIAGHLEPQSVKHVYSSLLREKEPPGTTGEMQQLRLG